MSVTRARLTRTQDPVSGDMAFTMVFFEDDLSPPAAHVRQVVISESELHHMRSYEALFNELSVRLQHKSQDVPGGQAALRALIEQEVQACHGAK